MIKSSVKLVLYISIISLLFGFGVYAFNFTPLINLFKESQILDILNFMKNFALLFFNNSYIMLFLSIAIIFFVIRWVFFK